MARKASNTPEVHDGDIRFSSLASMASSRKASMTRSVYMRYRFIIVLAAMSTPTNSGCKQTRYKRILY